MYIFLTVILYYLMAVIQIFLVWDLYVLPDYSFVHTVDVCPISSWARRHPLATLLPNLARGRSYGHYPDLVTKCFKNIWNETKHFKLCNVHFLYFNSNCSWTFTVVTKGRLPFCENNLKFPIFSIPKMTYCKKKLLPLRRAIYQFFFISKIKTP